MAPIRPGLLPVIALALLLSACGFRLAGTYSLPPELERIHLVTKQFSRDQQERLSQRLQAAGAEVLTAPDANAPRLTVTLRELPDRRLVTGAGTGKTVDRLSRRLDFSLSDAAGAPMTPARSISQQKDVVLDDDNLLSSGQERRSVILDLEQALFNRLIQQLIRI